MPDARPADRPTANFAAARHLLIETTVEKVELHDAFALRFAAAAYDAMVGIVARERRRCPFMTFEVKVHSDGGVLQLHMKGPEGARYLVAAELDLIAAACGNV